MMGEASRLAAQGGTIVSHAPPRIHWTLILLRDLLRVGVPSIAVVLTLLIAWQMRDTPLTWFDGILSPPRRPDLYPSTWLTLGHAIVPVVFLITNLVNRRYGDDYTIAHILLAWALTTIGAIAVLYRFDPRLPVVGEVPSLRVAFAFLGAMVLGQLAGAWVFEQTRGVVWWKAPLQSTLTSAFIAMFVFYPLAYAGTDWIWLHRMSVDAGVKAAMSFALLAPYWLLRPIVRPSAGLGGF
jgi:uncharacterized PurR-regulated membrane protein YhhQ (DUF165 family)